LVASYRERILLEDVRVLKKTAKHWCWYK